MSERGNRLDARASWPGSGVRESEKEQERERERESKSEGGRERARERERERERTAEMLSHPAQGFHLGVRL